MNHIAVYSIPGTFTVEILLVDTVTLNQLQSLGPNPGSGAFLTLFYVITPGDQATLDYLYATFARYRVDDRSNRPLFTFPVDTSPQTIVGLIQEALRVR